MSEKKKNPYDLSVLRKLLVYAKGYKLIFALCTFASILYAGFVVARPYFLQYAIDKGISTRDYENLSFYITLMFSMLLLEVITQLTYIYFSSWLGLHIVKDIRVQLFQKIVGFKKQYFDTNAIGKLVTRAVNDMDRIADVFSQGLFMIIADLLKMFAILGFMLYKSWQLTLIVLAILPVIVIATRIFHVKMKAAFEQVRTQVSNLNTFVQEHLSGMKIVQMFAQEDREFEKFKAINEKHKQGWIKTVWYNSIFFPIAELSGSLAFGFLVWYGGLKTIESDLFTFGLVVMFIELTNMLFRPLRQIADKFNTLQMGMVAAQRILDILEEENHIEENVTTTLAEVKGAISFKNVQFSYVKDELVLRDVSFEVKAGQTVAIVGATGAGKSTIISLLGRFYDINSGGIAIDGVDIKGLSLKELRNYISIVLQDVFLFADTILNNITLGNENITEVEVVAAAKSIGIHEFISSLPDGYQYNVKERGAMLSSGQRQLIAFLRAYIAKPKILVLDEATSSVDTHSEQLIQQATDNITEGRTSIVIAHRLATIKKADVILVMDKGVVVEKGTHHELLQKSEGYYKNLYEVQFGEEAVV